MVFMYTSSSKAEIELKAVQLNKGIKATVATVAEIEQKLEDQIRIGKEEEEDELRQSAQLEAADSTVMLTEQLDAAKKEAKRTRQEYKLKLREDPDCDQSLLLLPRHQRYSLRSNSHYLLVFGVVSILVITQWSGHSIYEVTCIDPLIELTVSVVRADSAFQIVWVVMACLVQHIYICHLIQKDAHVQFQRNRVTRASDTLVNFWSCKHPRNVAMREWRLNMDLNSDNRTRCNRARYTCISMAIYTALILLLSIPELAYVFCSNMERNRSITALLGNSFNIAVVRAFLANKVLPPAVRKLSHFKYTCLSCLSVANRVECRWRHIPVKAHQKILYIHRDVLASMITIVFISWIIVPVVTVVILDDGVYANPNICTDASVTACLRYYLQSISSDLYTQMEHVSFDSANLVLISVCLAVGNADVWDTCLALWILQSSHCFAVLLHVGGFSLTDSVELVLLAVG